MKRFRSSFRRIRGIAESLLILMAGAYLFLSLRGEHTGGSVIGDWVLANGSRETGALNLVSSIYLGFRAFDTLSETIVLLLAVSGFLFLTEKRK